ALAHALALHAALPISGREASLSAGEPARGAKRLRALLFEAELPGHEHQQVRGLANADIERLALPVTGLAVDPQQDRRLARIRGGCGLQLRGHLARVQRVHAAVVLARGQERRRIAHAFTYSVVRRVTVEVVELLWILGAAVLGHPVT